MKKEPLISRVVSVIWERSYCLLFLLLRALTLSEICFCKRCANYCKWGFRYKSKLLSRLKRKKNCLVVSRNFPPQLWRNFRHRMLYFVPCWGRISCDYSRMLKAFCVEGLQCLPSRIWDIFARAKVSQILIATRAAPKCKDAFHILKTNSYRGTPAQKIFHWKTLVKIFRAKNWQLQKT